MSAYIPSALADGPSAGSSPGVFESRSTIGLKAAVGVHPLVDQACRVGTPGTSRLPSRVRLWRQEDPDRLVLVSCLASFLVLPFIL